MSGPIPSRSRLFKTASGKQIRVTQGDLTEQLADAIVNPANDHLLMGGGVAGAIRKKGGQTIEDEAIPQGPIPVGSSVVTGAGALRARWVIHAATMGMDFRTDSGKIRDSVKSALAAAEKIGAKTVAFPGMGTGVGGFPLTEAADIMLPLIKEHLDGESAIGEVALVLHAADAFKAFESALGQL